MSSKGWDYEFHGVELEIPSAGRPSENSFIPLCSQNPSGAA